MPERPGGQVSKQWITPDGNYYEGEHVADGSVAVPPRPSPDHRWVSDEWVFTQAVPLSATKFQARAALMQTPSTNGYDHMLAEAEAVIAHSDTDEMMRMAWADSPDLWRDSPLMERLADGLGLSEKEVDDFMTLAASIEPWLYSRG